MRYRITSFSAHELVEMVRSGRLVLPEFQRDFVWKPDNVIELVRSLINGWPIGNLLMIEAPQRLGIMPLKGGPDVDEVSARLYLLDGQQRVTSLFHVLTGTGDVEYWVDFDAPDDEGKPSFGWTSRNSRRPRETSRIPIAQYADPALLVSGLELLRPELRGEAVEVRRLLLGELLTNSGAIPATVLDQTTSPASLSGIFETINRTGVRLGVFDLLVAATYSDRFSLRHAWKQALGQWPALGEYKVDGVDIVRLIALWVIRKPENHHSDGVVGIRQSDLLQLAAEDVEDFFMVAAETYARGLEFMRAQFGVVNAASIPSRMMLLTLAYWLNEDVAGIPAWYWSSIATQSYAQGANTTVIKETTGTEPPSLDLRDPSVRNQVRSALLESATKNRVLRLGLRGLIGTLNLPDPLDGSPMADSIREVYRGKASDYALADAVWCAPSNARALKRALSIPDSDLKGRLSAQGIINAESSALHRADWLFHEIEAKL